MVAAEDPQAGMFDYEVEDAQAEGHIRTYLELAEKAKEYRDAIKAFKDIFNGYPIPEDAAAIRVGPFRVPVTSRTGGDFHIKPWKSRGPAMRKIEAINEA